MTEKGLHFWLPVSLTLLILLFPLTLYCLVFVDGYPSDPAVLEIPQGTTSGEIASMLESRDLVRSRKLFLMTVLFEGLDGGLQSGEYEIKAGMTMGQIIKMLATGRVMLIKVTVPEGASLYEISKILDRQEITDSEKFLRLATEAGRAGSLLGTEVNSLEGYLYPDTYMFARNSPAEHVIRAMTDRFKDICSEIGSLNAAGLSSHEIVILASMIEKETGYSYEKKDISAVFHNRLRKGMRLESDPTAVYRLGVSYKAEVTKEDLRTDTPYNTYVLDGLPSGPISNPGKRSIMAALNPSEAGYLFFVSKGDGTHEFSDSYRKHLKLVKKYIKKKRN